MTRPAKTAEGESTNIQPKDRAISPLLRWAGGKQFLLPHLLRSLPSNWEVLDYCEPFLGAGSLFFALAPRNAVLGDANPHLIQFYRTITRNPAGVSKALGTHRTLGSKRHYYLVRGLYNRGTPGAAQGARFLYLNKSCFNGIFRVNRLGQFNVPYGERAKPQLPSLDVLSRASSALKRARLVRASFERTLSLVRKPTFIYLDPPYPALSHTSFFAHYTRERFTELDQARLAASWNELDALGCPLLMTNADTPLIRRLYRGMYFQQIPVVRYVSGGANKAVVRDLIITNYKLPTPGSM